MGSLPITRTAASLLAVLLGAVTLSACGGGGSSDATASSVTAQTTTPRIAKATDRLPAMDLQDAPTFDADPAGAAAQIARYWTGYQLPTGDVVDPIYQRAGIRYSEAEWAYVALHLAARTPDPQLEAFGLDAANWVAERPQVHKTRPSSFEDADMAGLAVDLQKLPASPERDRVAAKVKRWLAGYRPALLFDDKYHTNKSLVEAVGILDMLDAGVKLPRAAFWRARAMAVVGTSMPSVARAYTTSTPMGATTVFSDPPKNPISYHALTLGYLARATQILGKRTPIETRRLLVHMARGLVFLTGPDGDFAQWGRSQAQAWASSLGAYGLRVAAPYATARERGRMYATANQLLRRMQAAYHQGPYGLYYVPAFADLDRPYVEPRGVDPYANAVTYIPLALKGLAWLPDAPKAPTGDDATPEQDAAATAVPGVTRLNPATNGESVVVRRPRLWFGVRPAGMLDGNHGYDLRYDFGPFVAKVRNGDGAWVDVLRPRPATTGKAVDSAGPVLVTPSGNAYPTADGVRTTAAGVVTLDVAWMRGTSSVARGTVTLTPLAAGLRMTTSAAPAGTRFRVSVFARDPKLGKGTIRDGAALARVGRGLARVDPRARYGSAYDRVQDRVLVDYPDGAPVSIAYGLAGS